MHARHLIAPFLALFTLLGAGCERIYFGYVNHDVPPADASVTFAPDRGLALDIYRPHGAQGPAPVVVFFYGGAWKTGERNEYRFAGDRFAQAGMLAIVPDYRTYPKAGFPAFMDDAADAVAWARAHAAEYGGDPNRLFLAGHSAGAQIAGLLGTDGHYLARRGIKAGELAGVIGMSGPYDFNVGEEFAPIFGPPSEWPKAMAVNYVDGDEPPFLLIHGDHDKRVWLKNSVELNDKLHARHEPSTLVILPGGSHGSPLTGLHAPDKQPLVMASIRDFVRDPKAAH